MKKNNNFSESKRAQAFNEIIDRNRQQKNLIKDALSKIDATSNKKIVFDTEDDHETNGISEAPFKKQKLLESDDESDGDFNFEEKKQYEGASGQKLLALKSRFHNDERFIMDERFVEDDNEMLPINDKEDKDCSLEEEKRKELEILEGIIGNKKSFVKNAVRSEKKQGRMVRYDPSLPEHNKFIVQNGEKNEVNNSGKKKKRKDLKESVSEIVTETPVVSKDIFYKVSDNLKDALKEGQQFSLLSTFGRVDEEPENEEKSESRYEEIPKSKKTLGPNPFKYDSSDDESEEEKEIPGQTTEEPQEIVNNNNINQSSVSFKFNHEPFFFEENDIRLKETLELLKKLQSKEENDPSFSELRRNLNQMAKKKVKHNLKKNGPFKKKLGGKAKKKMKRLTKALKK